jgi:hypothetical protein
MSRPDGGWISGYASPTLDAARGVWSLREAFAAQRLNAWPVRPTHLLLHCDGANGSTTVTDSSVSGRTMTVVGSAAISTTQSKFGGESLNLPSGGSRVTSPNSTSWNLGTGSWTLECWLYTATVAQSGGFIRICNAGGFGVLMAVNSGCTYFLSSTGTSHDIANNISFGTLTTNQWNHIALVRSGNTFSPYINGTRGTTTTASAGPAIFWSSATTLAIGDQVGSSPTCFIDEVRVSRTALYSGASFTAPSAAFADQ